MCPKAACRAAGALRGSAFLLLSLSLSLSFSVLSLHVPCPIPSHPVLQTTKLSLVWSFCSVYCRGTAAVSGSPPPASFLRSRDLHVTLHVHHAQFMCSARRRGAPSHESRHCTAVSRCDTYWLLMSCSYFLVSAIAHGLAFGRTPPQALVGPLEQHCRRLGAERAQDVHGVRHPPLRQVCGCVCLCVCVCVCVFVCVCTYSYVATCTQEAETR